MLVFNTREYYSIPFVKDAERFFVQSWEQQHKKEKNRDEECSKNIKKVRFLYRI
jgi:hypothetical protein